MGSEACTKCQGALTYLKYWVRIGDSDPLFVHKCEECNRLQYEMSRPYEVNRGAPIHTDYD